VSGRLHILRHTFCSRLAMRGVQVMAIKELAGHASLSTTMRYMHLSPCAKRDAILMLDAPLPERKVGNSLATGREEAAKE